MSSAELTDRYLRDLGDIRPGFIVSLVTARLYMPWTALLSVQLAEVEGVFPVLSLLQVVGGGAGGSQRQGQGSAVFVAGRAS